MHKMPRPSDLMEACPNARTALLMQHIIYCSRYAKIGRGGFRWFISSHANYAANTGLSARQVRRSFAALREVGLIETEQHLHYGRNVTHVRVVYESGLPEPSDSGHPEASDSGLLEASESGRLIREDQKKDQKKDQDCEAAATGDEMKVDTPWMQGKAKKATEVVAKHNAKAKKRFSDEGLMAAMDRAEACPSTENLEKLFLVAWVAGGFGYRRKLPKKERGQLVELIEACASTELGVYLIVDSVKNWNLLAAHLKGIMKSSSPPAVPVPGYILASHVSVLAWVAKRAKQTAMQALAPEKESDGGGWGSFE